MPEISGYLEVLLNNLRTIREKAGFSTSELEEKLILGDGWISRFEIGETFPTLDMLLAILKETGSSLSDLLEGLPEEINSTGIKRQLSAKQIGNDLLIKFRYSSYDAEFMLSNATIDEYEEVVKTLRNGLAMLSNTNSDFNKAIKTDSVAKTFLKAVELWPDANPSDLWWFIIYRAYCDPYNHPAQFARLDFTQSWKRTGGWALEEILIRYYKDYLIQKGIHIFIADSTTKQQIFENIEVSDRLEIDKVDILLLRGA